MLTHDTSRAEAGALEDKLAEALELNIVDRSNAHDEEAVWQAFGDEAVEADGAYGQLSPREVEKSDKQR